MLCSYYPPPFFIPIFPFIVFLFSYLISYSLRFLKNSVSPILISICTWLFFSGHFLCCILMDTTADPLQGEISDFFSWLSDLLISPLTFFQ